MVTLTGKIFGRYFGTNQSCAVRESPKIPLQDNVNVYQLSEYLQWLCNANKIC